MECALLSRAYTANGSDFAGPYVGAGVTLDDIQGSGPDEGAGAWGVGARLGYKLNDSTVLYSRVGYARGEFGVKGCG